MGKIRVKTFDEAENSELEAKKKAKREAKKAQKAAEKTSKAEKPEEIETPVEAEEKTAETNASSETSDAVVTETKTQKEDNVSQDGDKKTKKEKFIKKKGLSKRVSSNKNLVSKTQTYPLEKAAGLLTQFKNSKFDETVELHINVSETGVSGSLKLPHGTGKTLRIKVADDAVLTAIESGKIDFDVLVASPDMMPKLAKVARVLGPRGLMPNPKNGTVSANPEDAVKKLSGGELRFKTEAKAPVIHLIIGKISFGDKKIAENAQEALNAIGQSKIKSATLTSTMSPGIKLQVN